VTVKELFYSNLDRFACRSSSVVFLKEESLVLFVAARRVWDVVLFSSGRKVVYLYCSLPLDQFGTSCCFPQGGKLSIYIVRYRSTSLGRRAVFLREESRLFVLFVTARPVWNVVLFSSGRKVFCLNRLSPLDQFETLCRLSQ